LCSTLQSGSVNVITSKLTGCHDCRIAFMYDVEGALIRKIKLLRINDLALTRDGTVMVMVTQEKLIKVQRLVFDGKDVCSAAWPCS
jgi:hypothetical protein